MGKRRKHYIPEKHLNPVVLRKKIEKLQESQTLLSKTIEELRDLQIRHGYNITAISKSNDNHLTMLSNFAKHDIKNSVQSMDSILGANTKEELSEEHIESLKMHIKVIRETVENFTKLVPYSKNDTFDLEQLLNAVEILNRSTFYENKIRFMKDIPDSTFSFHFSFQSVIQIVNNLIINAVKAFEYCGTNDKIIKLKVEIEADSFFLKIFDNAAKVSVADPDTIFDYGVSTTGGSGIGLYHAKYLCEEYKGDIKLITFDESEEFTKCFSISLPIIP